MTGNGPTVPFLFTSARMLGYWDGQRQHELMPGKFYGLTWDDETAWVSWQRPDVSGSLIMSLDGELLDLPWMGNVHAILYARDRLWITDTAQDQVVSVHWLDSVDYEVETFPLRPGRKDTLHLNSLWEWDRRVCVLESGLEGDGCPATITCVGDGELFEIGHRLFCHNFYVEDGWLYGCYKQREESGVYRMSVITGEHELHPMGENAFMRGMARGDGRFLFGQSVSVERDRRADGHSQVVVMDDDLRVVERVQLRDTGQLHAVRLLDGDRAHNGLPFPGEGIL